MDTVGMFQKFIKLFIAMCPLHVNVIESVQPFNKKRMRKCNDEVYQLAEDQALVKKLKKQKI
jgi:hypothetical protein